MNKPVCMSFRERLPELLAHPECYQLILHLHSPVWPLPCALNEYVTGLDDETRSLAEFVLACVGDPSFKSCARELEQDTWRARDRSIGDDDSIDVFI